MVLPFLTVLWPVVGSSFFASVSFHFVLLYAVVPTALISLVLGFRRHKRAGVLILGSLGLVVLTYLTLTESSICQHCIAAAEEAGMAFWKWSSDVLYHKGGMILGSALLCAAHYKNFMASRAEGCAH